MSPLFGAAWRSICTERPRFALPSTSTNRDAERCRFGVPSRQQMSNWKVAGWSREGLLRPGCGGARRCVRSVGAILVVARRTRRHTTRGTSRTTSRGTTPCKGRPVEKLEINPMQSNASEIVHTAITIGERFTPSPGRKILRNNPLQGRPVESWKLTPCSQMQAKNDGARIKRL